MGARGVPPKPTRLKLLEGVKPSRVNFAEPEAPKGTVICPDGVTAEVREVWDYALSNLDTMKIVSPADRDALLAYCEAVVTHRKASALLAKSPLLIQNARGAMMRNPAIAVQRDAAVIIRSFAHAFGFTPSARSEIRTGGTDFSGHNAARYLNGA